MMVQGGVEYFRNRERAERAAAKSTPSLAARRIHQELAQRYADLAQRQRGLFHVEEPTTLHLADTFR